MDINDFIKEQPSALEKSFISLREIGCGKANSSNQLTTYAANSQLISLVNPVNPKRRSRSLLKKNVNGMYEKRRGENEEVETKKRGRGKKVTKTVKRKM